MFDFLFAGIQAYNQIGMFIGALICLGIGGAILGYSLYSRLHAVRAMGTVIGVTGANGMYTPVYRYTLPNGETHEAKSDTSSGWTRGKETGRVVPLMISAHNPTEAQEANSYLFDIIGLVFLVPGFWLGYAAVTYYPVTKMTWIMAGAMLLYFGERIHRVIIPKGQRLSIAEWRKQHNLDGSASIDLKDVNPIEKLLSEPGVQEAQAAKLKTSRKWAPLVGAFALLLAAISVYQGYRISRLESTGLRAQGQVVDIKLEDNSSSSGSSYSYYPIVRYQTDKNLRVEFKDEIGSNPPSHRVGDKVTVLYLADQPQREAIIDRGLLWNWAIPGFLFLGAIFVAWLMVLMRRGTLAPSA